jgi:glycosyltransferase EpsE
MNPTISVALSVYNSEKTLGDCLDSILAQTYSDYEIIICDDGSSDSSFRIANRYSNKYKNIKVIRNERNMGLAFSLNRCIEIAKGEFIARQDADDRSTENRFEKQVRFLLENPEYDFVGCWVYAFDDNGVYGTYEFPIIPTMRNLVWGSLFCHGATLIRKAALEEVGNYTVSNITYRGQDYDLWLKMYAKNHKGYNLPEYLYYFRNDKDSYKRRKKMKYRFGEARIRLKRYPQIGAPLWSYPLCLKPIIAGLVPSFILRAYHNITVLKDKK